MVTRIAFAPFCLLAVASSASNAGTVHRNGRNS